MVFSFLFGRRRGPQRPDLRVVLYTRHGCHLCATAWQMLDEARGRHGFALEAVDVDSTAELATRYGNCVPVVTVNGRLRFRGAVNPVLLQRILDASPASGS